MSSSGCVVVVGLLFFVVFWWCWCCCSCFCSSSCLLFLLVDNNIRMKPYSEVSEVDKNQVTPPKIRFDSEQILFLVPPNSFKNTVTNQKQQHRTENLTYGPMDTSPVFTEITPLRLFWRTPFLRKSDSMNCSMHPCNGWTWKLRNMPSSWEQMWSLGAKIMERSRGFMKWMLMFWV